MKIGSYTLFKRTPPAIPMLGLEQAEAVFDRANGRIKGDETKAVPFAILATAEVLGARICIGDECAITIKSLEEKSDETRRATQEFKENIAKIIEILRNKIEQNEANLDAATQTAANQIEALMERRTKVTAVRDFFDLNVTAEE